MSNNQTTVEVTADTDSPVSTTQTTTITKTRASGTIHGDVVTALRILAGSTLHTPPETVIQISRGSTPDAVDFTTTYSVEAANPHTSRNVLIAGVEKSMVFRSDDTRTEHVIVQSPYESRRVFQGLSDRNPESCEYIDGYPNRWSIEAHLTDAVISDVIDNEFNIVLDSDALSSLYDPHPTYSINEDGRFIVTDEAHVDPGFYDAQSSKDSKCGHGKGGNPHNVVYYLEDGECPADGCNDSFKTFRSLRSHIGGSINGEKPDGPHDRVNLRLNDLTLVTETSL